MRKEYKLILLLCKMSLSEEEQKILQQYLQEHLDWDKVIGLLEIHRIAGLAWKNINKYFFCNNENRCTLPRLYHYLYNSYSLQKLRGEEQLKITKSICNLLDYHKINYALIKGISLVLGVYKDCGLRGFNDNDLLVHPNDLEKVKNILIAEGYVQGETKHLTKIIKSSRRDLLKRSMNSHEVMPFILKTNSDLVPQHIIDVHFSINLMSNKRNLESLEEFLFSNIELVENKFSIKTLNNNKHLMFLCEHFYKEAISFNDLKMYKDNSIYKLCDIYYFIKSNFINWEEFNEQCLRFGFSKQVYLSMTYLKEIFNEDEMLDNILPLEPQDKTFLNKVFYYNSDQVAFQYENENFVERVFDIDKPKKILHQNK
ncbi:nucleotidyltransferase family protein [Oceanobacillus sp. CFH 90083]|uniref:nucleotidyltransferase family protein n=1 Tax=Oceanobacillus sp. CFH 90083 TaxID=2592336 RepID=UPI00128B95AE|nr:nucleotidyltransferase family protein [Oceanobacillus sp. CFH 90083]